MKIALQVSMEDASLRFARQLGVRHAVWSMAGDSSQAVPYETFARAADTCDRHGLRLCVLEGLPHRIYRKAMYNLPGRDEEIDNVCACLRDMARAGIEVLSYQWMPLGGLTTDVVRGRGGAAQRRFDLRQALRRPASVLDWRRPQLYDLPQRELGAEEVWEHLTYFLQRVLPVAEEAKVKLAMHPDDPPIPSFLGVDRILHDLAGLQRLIDAVPSPCNGLNLCQGCVSEMPGVDVVEAIRHFGRQGKIFFAHYRDTQGTVPLFDEVFFDEGDTDMYAAMKAYGEVGVDVCIRADHTPRVVEDNDRADRGFAYEIGYMLGMQQVAANSLAALREGRAP